jgi:hypothetical protein
MPKTLATWSTELREDININPESAGAVQEPSGVAGPLNGADQDA